MIFTPDSVKDRLREQPFRPLQIVMTSGQTHDVWHPDLVFVTEESLIVGLPSTRTLVSLPAWLPVLPSPTSPSCAIW